MNFNQELDQRTEYVNTLLRKFLPAPKGFQSTLIEAMRYSMLAGGKRLRPILLQLTYELFDGSDTLVEPFMAAIEMIHTHSLVHDDLPALDNDLFRRGKRTTHAVYGEAMGILSGDGLLNLAYETALQAFSLTPSHDYGKVVSALQVLAEKTGVYGMLGGQSADVEAAGKIPRYDQLDFIYELKTGALIEAAMMSGALLAGAKPEEVSLVERTAADIGLAFQIQDDILDITGSLQNLGKPVKSDSKNQKTTYVTIRSLEQAQADVKDISERAIANLKKLPMRHEFLEALLLSLIDREK